MAEAQCKWPGRITCANPVFVEIRGFDKAELIGLPHNIMCPPP